MERTIKIQRPPAHLHFSVAECVNDGWKLQLASARRYHREHFLNLGPLAQPFRFAMKMECLKAVLPQLPPNTILVMLDAMNLLFNNSLDSLIATYHEIVRSLGKDTHRLLAWFF
jgi:hypothetical protein